LYNKNKTTHAFYTLLYQECKRLGSHSAFETLLSKDLFLRRAWRWFYKNRNTMP